MGLVFPDLRFHVLYFVISYFWIVVWVFSTWDFGELSFYFFTGELSFYFYAFGQFDFLFWHRVFYDLEFGNWFCFLGSEICIGILWSRFLISAFGFADLRFCILWSWGNPFRTIWGYQNRIFFRTCLQLDFKIEPCHSTTFVDTWLTNQSCWLLLFFK